jgi:hypothetical protein
MPPTDLADDYESSKLLAMRDDMHTWVIDNYPTIYASGGYKKVETHSIGLGKLYHKIREALDPNHIMYKPGDARLEPDEEEPEKKAASAL